VRTLTEIREDLNRARNKRDEIKEDIDRIYETNGRELDAGQSQRVENLVRGLTNANHEVEEYEDEIRDNFAEGLRSGVYSTESTEFPERRLGESSRSGDPRLRGVRDQALRANERADFLPDESKAHMEGCASLR
jgi:hypothetical protein